jgi:hypothetical protein
MTRSGDTIGVRGARFVRKVGRAWARTGVIVAVTAGLGGALAGACFHPREVPCAFSCVSPGARCPTGFTCGTDGLCHRDGAEGCTLTPPDAGAGGASGASSDAAAVVPDASTDDGTTDGDPDVVTP